MVCQNATLAAGDVLYMPKGMVHYATTRANVSSTHLTIGLLRKGRTWRELFQRQCRLAESGRICQQFDGLLADFSTTAAGLVWNDLAAAPFADNPMQGLCDGLADLMFHHSAALARLLKVPGGLKANSYELSRHELLQHLQTVAACNPTALPMLVFPRMTNPTSSGEQAGGMRLANELACVTGLLIAPAMMVCDVSRMLYCNSLSVVGCDGHWGGKNSKLFLERG